MSAGLLCWEEREEMDPTREPCSKLARYKCISALEQDAGSGIQNIGHSGTVARTPECCTSHMRG